MKNSDLFLELFDDDQLRPQENITAESCLGKGLIQAKPDDALSEKIENSETTGSDGNFCKKNGHEGCKKPLRTEFDFCSALEEEKNERKKKYDKMVAKIKGGNKLDLSGEMSMVHRGDTDSSEDEDNKYMESCNYNSFGVEIKRLLETSRNNPTKDEDCNESPSTKSTHHSQTNNFGSNRDNINQLSLPQKKTENTCKDYVDPFFGIRITEPVISREGMRIRMAGKAAVRLSQVQTHLAKTPTTDFVVAAVLVRSVTKRAQNETQYVIWELSELKEDKANISLFLFGQSYKQLWKIPVATVVAILNPASNNKKGSSDSVSLVVKQADQVMIWGKSKDFALCKSMKKNGERCSAVVNRSVCEFCVYHVSKEYSKFSSSRSDIRSYVGHSGSNFLKNKVLGKNEVFYAGKSYTATKGGSPATVKVKEKTNKVAVKDKQRLSGLGCSVINSKPDSGLRSNTVSLPYSARAAQALRAVDNDSHILKSLSSPTTNGSVVKAVGSVGNLRKSEDSQRVISTAKPVNSKLGSRIPTLTDPADDQQNGSHTQHKDKNKVIADTIFSKTNNVTEKFTSGSVETGGKCKNGERPVSKSLSHRLTTDRKDIDRSRSQPGLPILTDPNVKDSESKVVDVGLFAQKIGSSVSELSKVDTPLSDRTARTGKDLQQKFKSLFDVACADVSTKMKAVDTKSSNILQSEVGRSEGCSTEVDRKPRCATRDASSHPLHTTTSPSTTKISRAKIRALMFVKRNGPIAKEDPNKLAHKSSKRERKDSEQGNVAMVGAETGDGKVVFSELYVQLMRQTSQQEDLVEAEKLRQEEEYFDKMGLKEQLEEKMLNTYKIDCKAVKCLQCKYIWFSAAELCKAERHTLKIVDAVKRFFKCGKCNNRTVSLHILPVFRCTNCQASNWQRAPMMREKICKTENQLSIRGGEQKFTNSQVTNTSLNLLVPE